MNVENAIGKGSEKLRREQAHVSSETDQIRAVLAQAGYYIGVVLSAFAALGDKDGRRQPQLFRSFDPASLGHVRDHNGNIDALEPSGAERLGNGHKIRPATGEKNPQPDWIAAAAHVYCTRRSPLTTRPIT